MAVGDDKEEGTQVTIEVVSRPTKVYKGEFIVDYWLYEGAGCYREDQDVLLLEALANSLQTRSS